jgi:hypothetical protein
MAYQAAMSIEKLARKALPVARKRGEAEGN